MTTEEDFQRALEADPEDYQTRLVFADWLQERDDPRSAGYRAMGRLRISPDLYRRYENLRPVSMERAYFGRWANSNRPQFNVEVLACLLPDDWFSKLETTDESAEWWVYYKTRRDAEDGAARAFARLPLERQAELLAQEPLPA